MKSGHHKHILAFFTAFTKEPTEGFEPYRFSTPVGFFLRPAGSKKSQPGFESLLPFSLENGCARRLRCSLCSHGSRRRDSNPRPTVYKTVALPLSYVGAWRRGRGHGCKKDFQKCHNNHALSLCLYSDTRRKNAEAVAPVSLPVSLRRPRAAAIRRWGT